MNKIDLIDQNSGLKYNIGKIEEFCLKVLEHFEIRNWEFSILFCDDQYIAELNTQYRQKDGPTDVLTFCDSEVEGEWSSLDEDESLFYAGDIVISIDTLLKNSEYFKVDEIEEMKRLLIHGILHLKGMDHQTNNEDEGMLLLQESLLQYFGDCLF